MVPLPSGNHKFSFVFHKPASTVLFKAKGHDAVEGLGIVTPSLRTDNFARISSEFPESVEESSVFLSEGSFQCSCSDCSCLFLQLLVGVGGVTVSLMADSLLVCCPLPWSRHPSPAPRACSHGEVRAACSTDVPGDGTGSVRGD